ncbi:complex I NDUFA9 subunit family protein [soil metagenome]
MLLITGANGFVGSALCRVALARGWQVAGLCRAGANSELLPVNARRVEGDFTNEEQMRALLLTLRPDAIIHSAAIVSSGRPDMESSLRVNVQGTAALLRAARECGVRRWLQVSSMSAHAANKSAYGASKFLADEEVRASDMDWTILRPSLVYGSQKRGIFHRMAQMIGKLPVVPVLGGGHEQVRPVHADDLASAFLGALSAPESIRRTYQLGGPEHWTLRDLLLQMRKQMGRPARLVPVPMPICRLGAIAAELILDDPPVTTDNLEGIAKAQSIDTLPAERDLAFAPRPFAQGFAEYLR